MTQVSTSAQLLHSLKLDDFIYGVVGTRASEPSQVAEDNGVSLWNIPGMGVLGVGAATAALIAWYVANPNVKEYVDEIGDIFGDTDRDTRLDDVAEQLGKKGEEFDPNAKDTADGKPRVEATPVPLPTPKAEPKVDPVEVKPATPKVVGPTEEQISRGYQMPGSSMPAPTKPLNKSLAVPTAEIDQVLRNTSKSEGVDYRTLYALAGSESSFSAGANASSSSAVGLFQFTAPTWTYLTTKVYPELGYTASDRTDPSKSAVVASRYIKSIQASLRKKLGRDPSLGETYLGYFMGPTGAHNFLDALAKNPNAKGADVFASAASANPNLFFNKGKKDQPLTLQETMDRLEGKVTAYAEQAGAVKVAASTETAPDMKGQGGAKVAAVNAAIPATSTPQPVAVRPPDFDAYKGGAKGEARNEDQPGAPQGGGQQSAPTQVASAGGGSKQQGETSYMRDKQGRLISIRS